MAEKKDSDLNSKEYTPKSKLEGKSIVVPQKVATIYFIVTEEKVGKQSIP